MRSDHLVKHIGLMHGEKANKKQKEVAKKARKCKWYCCDKCFATMDEKNKVRHLRACTGESISSISKAGHRKVTPIGRPPKSLDFTGTGSMINSSSELGAQLEAIERKGTLEALQRKWSTSKAKEELLEQRTADDRQEVRQGSYEGEMSSRAQLVAKKELQGEAAARHEQIQRMIVSILIISIVQSIIINFIKIEQKEAIISCTRRSRGSYFGLEIWP